MPKEVKFVFFEPNETPGTDIEMITKLIGSRFRVNECNRLKPFMKKNDEKRYEMCSG
jgi:hypothetical protein